MIAMALASRPAAAGRRAHDGARRDLRGRFSSCSPTCNADRHGRAAHHTRPEPGAPLCRPRGRDGAGRAGRAGPVAACVQRPAARLHPPAHRQPAQARRVRGRRTRTHRPRAACEEPARGYPTPLPGVRGWFKKGEFVAVQGADLCLLPGRTLGVVGESGSGKSTLAQACWACCRTRAARGGGQAGSSRHAQPNRQPAPAPQVQVVFQDPFSSLSPRLTVEEIVGEGLRCTSLAGWAERRRRVEAALAEVGLTRPGSPACWRATRTNSRAASASAWRLRARSSCSRGAGAR
jgi:ABC-type glutathione transport system ATPase component